MSIKSDQGKSIDRADDIPYSIAGLERAIRSCQVNIKTFEDAINTEHANMGKFNYMLETLKRKEKQQKKITISLEETEEDGD